MNKKTEKRPVILVASFGTTFNSSRSITIGAIESTLAETFPDHDIRRAFTSNIIRKILRERDGICVDSVPEALEKLAAQGVRDVAVMPTHMMEGDEYNNKIAAEAEKFRTRFDSLKIGRALLTADADYDLLIDILRQTADACDAAATALVFMGHGTEHSANETYSKLQRAINARGIKNMFIGTVEATPTVEDVVEMVRKSGAKEVVLSPLMIVAGDHATNDMAGDDPDSWKSIFERAGFAVRCRVTGLGSIYGVQKMIADHCREIL